MNMYAFSRLFYPDRLFNLILFISLNKSEVAILLHLKLLAKRDALLYRIDW